MLAATDDELARLALDVVPPDRLVWTAYFFSHFFSEWDERQAFREALLAADFTGVGSDEELSGNGYWHHWSHTIRPADGDGLRAADRSASAIARAHHVRYDEWQIFRDLQTGELRPASSSDDVQLRAQDARSMQVARRARERRK
jgi:hypothetical protein